MKALVNIKAGLKIKLPHLKTLAHHVHGVGKCPKCGQDAGLYFPNKRHAMVCKGCWRDVEEVNGSVLLEGKEHYKYKEASKLGGRNE